MPVFNIPYEAMWQAYIDCRKRKKNTPGAKKFALNAFYSVVKLTDEINAGKYKLRPSSCFIVKYPVPREVFCAAFCDRIVQHFIYNELNPVIEKLLIKDTASCRKGKGTDYAIRRVASFLRSETANYTEDAFICKGDLQGFFMSIDREDLYNKIADVIVNYYEGDYADALLYLCKIVILTDVTVNAKRLSPLSDWDLIPPNKTLFGNDHGIAIGNITSQLFANYDLNDFDHYMKSRHRHYERYVDDFVIVDKDKGKIRESLAGGKEILSKINQKYNKRKTQIRAAKYGVTFLGVDVKPYYNVLSKSRINRIYKTERETTSLDRFVKATASRKGMFKRYHGYRIAHRFVEKSKFASQVLYLADYKIIKKECCQCI